MQFGSTNPQMMGMGMGGMNPGMMGMGGMNPGMGTGMSGMNPGMMPMGGMNPGMMPMGVGMIPGMMPMGGVNPGMMPMGGMNPGMMGMGVGMGGMNPGMMPMGGMMPSVGQNQGSNASIEDIQGWNLIFENQNDRSTITIRISEQKYIKEAISVYMIKSGRTDKCKFIFNNKELFPEMKICQSGLTNLSKILVISIQNIIGAF